jgi:hypothetical protein
LRRTLCISIGAALRNGCMGARASHDGFLTKCGQNHDALLTALWSTSLPFSSGSPAFLKFGETVPRGDDSGFVQPVLA